MLGDEGDASCRGGRQQTARPLTRLVALGCPEARALPSAVRMPPPLLVVAGQDVVDDVGPREGLGDLHCVAEVDENVGHSRASTSMFTPFGLIYR